MNQQTAAVDVPQEIVPQSCPFAGPLYDAGNIGQDKRDPLFHIYHSQIGKKSSKVVIGNLRLRLGHH